MMEYTGCKAMTGTVLMFKILHNHNRNKLLKEKNVSNAILTTQGFT